MTREEINRFLVEAKNRIKEKNVCNLEKYFWFCVGFFAGCMVCLAMLIFHNLLKS